jgi:hypothetical protein
MINLRYHIVSITAVFLALAIGIAMGSTFIDKATVDQLRRNIDGVEAKANRVNGENATLRDQIGTYATADKALSTDGLPTLLAGSLSRVPLVMLVGNDVGDDTVKQVQSLMVAAGADFAGTLRFDDRLRKLTPQSDDSAKLAALLKVTSTDSTKLLHELAAQLGDMLAVVSRPDTEGTSGHASSTSTTGTASTSTTASTTSTPGGPSSTQPETSPPLLQRLIDAGFVDFDPPAGAPGKSPLLATAGQRVVVLGAPRPPAPAGTLDLDAAVLLPTLQRAVRRGGIEMVAASSLNDAAGASDPASVRSLFVAPLRADKTVASRLSTVDDLDHATGLLALVWALEETASARYGQYGIGPDAVAVLPQVGP